MDRFESDLARTKEELADSFHEELEMELDEAPLEGLFVEMVPASRRRWRNSSRKVRG
ncbi:MAG TPA: hypothetical protein VKQ09_11410 [Sphingomonas sp.]|nr:hypothetical protein [Sphingomonas sp.]